MATEINWAAVPLGILAGTLRGSAPFLFVSLGECLTEKSGKINLGLEGTLLMGAMSAYAISYLGATKWGLPPTVSPWLGVLVAGIAGMGMGFIHAWLSQQPKVNDVAVGIAMIIFGSGMAFFLGKPFIQPQAPRLPSIFESGSLIVSWLFVFGVILAPLMDWFFKSTRPGLFVRAVGDSPDAALAMGVSIHKVRMLCIMAGSFLAGIGGSYLSLVSPGSWTEKISSGQGLMAVALVIFARWNPIQCLWASLFFGGAQAIGPTLQAVGIEQGYYLFSAAPYILTLIVMVITCSPKKTISGAPGALGTISG
jgi:general nucleoside transport system permease protein